LVQKKTPILAVTGKVFDVDLKLYNKAGINHTLKKPFSKEELYQALVISLSK